MNTTANGIFLPSPQQAAVYQWVRDDQGNLMLVAVAGAGKTTTLIEAVALMTGSVAMVVYNKKNAVEMSAKLEAKGLGRVQAGTFHSFGFRNWRRVAPKVKVDDKKMNGILDQMRVPEHLYEFTLKLVSMAKQRAIGVLCPMGDTNEWNRMVAHYDLDMSLPDLKDVPDAGSEEEMVEEGIGYAIGALRRSLELDKEVIDFDDMIYAPLAHDTKCWQNDWLLVDEAQDTNPARRALAKKMLRPGGRAIFVGDPAQAIYGFTGADNDSLDIIKKEFACTELPLTVTYRCPKAVVRAAQQYVSHIQAAETAPEGEVRFTTTTEFDKLTATELNAKAAMLCRTTAPLVSMAYSLIKRGVPCHVEGKDIGRGLVALTKKWVVRRVDTFLEKLDEYTRREIEKFLAKGQEQKAESLADKQDTIRVIASGLLADATMDDLRRAITNLFGDTADGATPANFTLSTVHKSKGREWQTVYLLDRAKLMPSRFARQTWQIQQEYNLIYVAFTRSQGTLVEVTSVPK